MVKQKNRQINVRSGLWTFSEYLPRRLLRVRPISLEAQPFGLGNSENELENHEKSWAGGSEPEISEIWGHFSGKRPQEISKRCLRNTRQRGEDFEVCLSQGCQESKWGKQSRLISIDLDCALCCSHMLAVPQSRYVEVFLFPPLNKASQSAPFSRTLSLKIYENFCV